MDNDILKEESDRADAEFKKSFQDFLDFCIKIIEFKENNKLIINQNQPKNPILKQLERCNRLFEKMEFEDYPVIRTPIKKIYRNYRSLILDEDYLWLTQNDVKFDISDKLKIPITLIYREATALSKRAEAQTKDLSREQRKSRMNEIQFPRMLACKIYHLFYLNCIVEDEREKLEDIYEDIRHELGLNQPKKNTAANNDNPMAGMFGNLMKGLATQAGLEIPENAQMPDMSALGSMFSQICNKPETQNLLKTVGDTFKNAKTDGDIINGLAAQLGDPSTQAIFKSGLGSIIPQPPEIPADKITEIPADRITEIPSGKITEITE